MKNEYDERVRPVPGKKNKKKWCKGKAGKEHKPSPYNTKYAWAKGKWWELICDECGKRLEFYYPFIGSSGDNRVPDWVPIKEKK